MAIEYRSPRGAADAFVHYRHRFSDRVALYDNAMLWVLDMDGVVAGCIGVALAEYNPDWQVDIADICAVALTLARENIAFQHVEGRVEAIQSDLFAGLQGRRYDLIVSNPPYVTDDEYAALPGEYRHEPKLGLTSGADGLDLCLRLLAEAAEHLTDNGLLIVEVGESEHALAALLPTVPFVWIEFKVGAMGVFALERRELVEHAAAIRHAAAARRAA